MYFSLVNAFDSFFNRYFASFQPLPTPKTVVEEPPSEKSPLTVLAMRDNENITEAVDSSVHTERDIEESENVGKEVERKQTSTKDLPVVVKAPLSPVQTNTLEEKPETKPLKRGKLTDLFSFKSDKNFEISCSPSVKRPFKPVIASKSPAVLCKENSVTSDNSDVLDSLSSSQRSCVSEVSGSDVGSIDNESFGLTSQETLASQNSFTSQNSPEKIDKEVVPQEDTKTSPVFLKSPLVSKAVFVILFFFFLTLRRWGWGKLQPFSGP